jgi:ADP-heptose:LPS heptosyltransferase
MKFLFIRFSSIGDIVLTSPVIRCLKQQYKGAEIHFLLLKSYSPVVAHNPYIDKIIFFDEDPDNIVAGLRKEKYDFVIDLQKNFRSFKLKHLLGVRHISFNKLNIRKWIYVNFKINVLPDIHIVDRYMQAVRSFGIKNDGAGLDYFISPEDENVLTRIPELFRKNNVGFVIGARHFTKRLPAEKIISIINKINSPVILLGGKEDFENGELISKTNPDKIFNSCGKFSLNESAALVKNASKIITHDTGLMHIAAAFKKDIFSVWGNTVPQFGMYPYYGDKKNPSSIILEVNGLSCRPCSKIGFEKCPRGHFKCMKEIDETVFLKE